MNVGESRCSHVNVVLLDGWVLSGNEPIPDPVLTKSLKAYGVTRLQRVKSAGGT